MATVDEAGIPRLKSWEVQKPGPILPFFHRFLTYEEVDDMSTEDIIQRLDSIGGCV